MARQSTVHKILDVRGDFCPGPVLKARREMDSLAPGEVLQVLATDPAAEADLQAWAKWAGHQVIALQKEGGELRVLIRKGS